MATTKPKGATSVEASKYGHMITIPVYGADGDQKFDPVRKAPKEFKFGAAKAASIVAHMADIKAFAQKYQHEVSGAKVKAAIPKGIDKMTKAEITALLIKKLSE